MKTNARSVFWVVAAVVLAVRQPLSAQNAEQDVHRYLSATPTEPYRALGDAIVIHNGTRYHNRPLYCRNIAAFVLAGDRPCVRLASDPYVYGCFRVGYIRQGRGVWLDRAADRQSLYRPGRMEWQITDPIFVGTQVVFDVVPLPDGVGLTARITVRDAQLGDRLVYAFGGATQRPPHASGNIAWALDPLGTPALQTRGFVPEDCTGNVVRIEGDRFVIVPPAYEPAAKVPPHLVAGRCSAAAKLAVVDATAINDPLRFIEAIEAKLPIARGVVDLQTGENVLCWAVEGFVDDKVPGHSHLDSAQQAFEAGMKRVETVGRRVVVDTPDPRLNAVVAATCHALDGAWYPPVYVHGGMLWNVPFPGWRTLYGPTAFGWHDRVLEQAKYYLSHQVIEDTKREPKASAALGLGQQAKDSRFYGKGRIDRDQAFYNFQSVFFDMLIHAWRWTGDPELEKLLRPALPRHLEWQRECFDPDDDGLYESYINTWPTDSVWYAGGAGAEETAYAYTGHLAAAELARRAGDLTDRDVHRQQADKIREAFLKRFWIADRGYVGCWIEQTNLKRLHTDSWLYSIFLPIDAGLLSQRQMVQALYYTEWGLQRVQSPLGGQRCWTSNWVPSVWSTRVLYPGDNYHLALAYFKADLPDKGWDLLRGFAYEAAYNGAVPGCVAISIGGTDFTDCTSLFARAVVEGLFGFRPDYVASRPEGDTADEADGMVRCAPRLPARWDHASITTPDFSLSYQRTGDSESYHLRLSKASRIEFDVLANGSDVSGILEGAESEPVQVLPGLQACRIEARVPQPVREATLVVRSKQREKAIADVKISGRVGAPIILEATDGEIRDFDDPQGVIKGARIQDGRLYGTLLPNVGHHLVFVRVENAGGSYWQAFRVDINEKAGVAGERDQVVDKVPADAGWQCVDMNDAVNGDIRAIYQQQYVSPRPNTCSLRIGTDGYSPWTFYYWALKPPAIDLKNVADMCDEQGRVQTPQGVPFAWPGAAPGSHLSDSALASSRNIAFTSTWDNWPSSIGIPVGRQGEAVWLLVCGTTNPMQTRIANGEIRLVYVDGVVDKIDLVPPINFWTLCPIRGADYDYTMDGFCLPAVPPATVQLGENCRALLLNRRLRSGVTLDRVELETLSPEVVIGLMGVTIMTGG